jgi:hypothetical protein
MSLGHRQRFLPPRADAWATHGQLNPSDIEIYDIQTGLSRRVTSQPSNFRAYGLAHPYLILMHRLNLSQSFLMNDFYVANLVALGITDVDGRVLPGDGVLGPP